MIKLVMYIHTIYSNDQIGLESYISSHVNKKDLSPFYHKNGLLIENECKTPIGWLTFIFYQKYFHVFIFLCDDIYHVYNEYLLNLIRTHHICFINRYTLTSLHKYQPSA